MNKSILKSGFVEVNNYLDKETGELFESVIKKHTYIANSKEEFFIGYVKILSVFSEISGNSIKTYAWLLMNYKVGVPIAINKSIKEQVCNFSKTKSVGTIDNTLLELVDKELLFRPENTRGLYYINPRYAFKGSTSDRDKSLKTIIELGCKDC